TDETDISDYSQNVPIGRPLDNETVHILDGNGNPVPIGVPGELHIGGMGVALGYLNRPELTQEKFIDDSLKPGTGMYKTGDLARWLAGGSIEFIGRIDHQVKIRGFRVELGEIEARLKEPRGVKESIVVVQEDDNGEKQLVTYVVAYDDTLSIESLKSFLKKKLPGYMLPSVYVILDKLPLTPGGKVDRRGLLNPEKSRLGNSTRFVGPRDLVEMKLERVWSEILNVPEVGVFDDFFELGGHSLLAVRLMDAIHREFGVDLTLSTLIEGPCVAQQADKLRNRIDTEPSTPLVCIQGEGDKAPFFCVHPVGGNVLCYVKLAHHLKDERPFYGLQSAGLNGRVAPESIEDMAAVYIEAIRKVQAQGPYYLGGWSMGGVIAYEMVQQLQQTGEEVVLLALIDSYTPATVRGLENDYMKEYNLREKDLDALLLMNFSQDLFGEMNQETAAQIKEKSNTPEEFFNQVVERAKSLDLISTGKESDQIQKLFNIFKTNTLAMNKYTPKSYKGDCIRLFYSSNNETVKELNRNTAGGWGKLVNGSVLIKKIPGNHYTIFQEPNVKFLAETLSSCFR
ncbi:MAG: AMP-binding protein, partial [Planctomycetes bacterium]|nr:AMP-binding protein [Planctomycetota bacterium]